MKAQKITIAAAATMLAGLALTGCTSSGSTTGSAYGPGPGGSGAPASGGAAFASRSADGATLATASTSLGTVVVDARGLTVYFYGQDKKGETASTCTGVCAAQWPPVTATGTPKLTGITGHVGTMAGPGGMKQVTIDGLPIYTFAGDSAKGDVNGQLLGDAWWAITPSGAKITKPTPSSSTGY